MQVAVRVKVDKVKWQENFDKFIDTLHETFGKNLLDEAQTSEYPRDKTGLFRVSWGYERIDKHHSHVFNPTPQARFLQGTGLWGPTKKPICARGIKPLTFFWRAQNRWVRARCVGGIDPTNIHGLSMSDTYDFIDVMNQIIHSGVSRSYRELR
jgi:hypothetical protein